jgi:hypothetical protein
MLKAIFFTFVNCQSFNLETAVDRFKVQLSLCSLTESIVNNAHRFGESATGPIAHFSGSLDYVARPSNVKVASCSRWAAHALPESQKNAHSNLSNCRF